MSSPFKKLIMDEIYKKSPIGISEFMRIVSTHSVAGYYTTKANILGRKGDFITSPEISQIFGECIGIFIGKAYPSGDFRRVNIIEFGPGTGTLASDILRTLHQLQRYSSALFSYIAIETNPYFINAQREKITKFVDKFVTFGSLNEIYETDSDDKSLTVYLAHEFLDALPIDVYCKEGTSYSELKVVKDSCGIYFEKFPLNDDKKFNDYIRLNLKEGNTIEYSADVEMHAQWIRNEVKKRKEQCLGLLIDYGFDKPSPFSLRAILRHQFVGLFDNIGEADYSVNVDFQLIRGILEKDKSISCELFTQSRFLIDNGIFERMQSLSISNPAISGDLKRDVHRLISPAEMGQIYKVLAFKSR